MSQSSDVILTNRPVYQTGALGRYYYPTNDGNLSRLLDVGSRSVEAAGLPGYTMHTNQSPDNCTVDIGFHYAPVRGIAEIPKSTFTLTSSSDNLGFDLGSSADGLLDTFWVTSLGAPGCSNTVSGWLRVDLGSSKEVTRLAYGVDPVSSNRAGAVWQ